MRSRYGWPIRIACLKRLGLARLNERQQQAHRTRFARGGAVDELFDRRLEFADPLATAVLGDNHALGKRRGEDRGEVAGALGPAARIAGGSWTEPRRQRRMTIADR